MFGCDSALVAILRLHEAHGFKKGIELRMEQPGFALSEKTVVGLPGAGFGGRKAPSSNG